MTMSVYLYSQGRNGWWLYDKRASDEIEAAYSQEATGCQLLIAGHLYIIDFDKMLQYRRDEPQRQRRIKRERADAEGNITKGIAGIRQTAVSEGGSQGPEQASSVLNVSLPSSHGGQAVRQPLLGAESMAIGSSAQHSNDSMDVQSGLEDELDPSGRDLIMRLENSTIRNSGGRRETYL